MQAKPGDRLLIHGHRLGEPDRGGKILEVHGRGGEPPFVVRWDEDGPRASCSPAPMPPSNT